MILYQCGCFLCVSKKMSNESSCLISLLPCLCMISHTGGCNAAASLKVCCSAEALSCSACLCSCVALGVAVISAVLALVPASVGGVVWKQFMLVFMKVLL